MAITDNTAATAWGWVAWVRQMWRSLYRRPQSAPDQSEQPATPAQRAQIEQLFARYHLPLLEFLYGMTHDREWAADLAQETFLRAYTSERAATVIAHPQAWLYRIATNVALTALQRRRRFGWVSLNQAEMTTEQLPLRLPELRVEDIAATIAERDAVWRVLVELPPRWRAVLLLQTVADFSVREIADELQLTEVHVRKLLFLAKERYRALHAQFEGGRP